MFDLLWSDVHASSCHDLGGDVVNVIFDNSNTAMRHEMTEVSGFSRLMHKEAIAKRYLDFSQRIWFVASFNMFAGFHIRVAFIYPFAVGPYPFRIPNNLCNPSLSYYYRILFHSNADFIGFYFFAVLPEGQPKGRYIYSNPDIGLIGLQSTLLNFASGEFVRFG